MAVVQAVQQNSDERDAHRSGHDHAGMGGKVLAARTEQSAGRWSLYKVCRGRSDEAVYGRHIREDDDTNEQI